MGRMDGGVGRPVCWSTTSRPHFDLFRRALALPTRSKRHRPCGKPPPVPTVGGIWANRARLGPDIARCRAGLRLFPKTSSQTNLSVSWSSASFARFLQIDRMRECASRGLPDEVSPRPRRSARSALACVCPIWTVVCGAFRKHRFMMQHRDGLTIGRDHWP